ncbi:hypothetical protein Tco_1427596, partial [Tanacetum coccineum]
TQALIDAVTAALPSPPLPPLPLSLYIPLPVDRRDDIPDSEQPPRKRLCLSTLGSRYEIGKSSTARPTRDRGVDYGFVSTIDAEARQQWISEVGYGIMDTWVDPTEAVPEIAPMTMGEDSRSRISQRVDMDSQRVDLLMGDKMTLQETVWMMQQAKIAALQETNRRRQAQMVETLHVMRDMRREMGDMQIELLALRGQRRARQPAPDARISDHQDALGDADSHVSGLCHFVLLDGQIRTLGLRYICNGIGKYSRKKDVWYKYCPQGEYLGELEIESVVPKETRTSEIRKAGPIIDEVDDSIQKQPWSPTTTLQEAECRQGTQGDMVVLSDGSTRAFQERLSKVKIMDGGNDGNAQRLVYAVQRERESRLAVISYSKAQEYMAKGCQVFLAQISAKKEEDKSEGKQIKDVPIIRDFPEVFPEDLPGLPPARPVEFQIDLIP